MPTEAFVIKPFSLPLGDTTVSAVLQFDSSTKVWEVIVVFGRDPNQELMKGDEVDAQLRDSKGAALKVLERPSETLVEAGGSLGVSANARFRFQDSGHTPVELHVTYRGQSVQFQIMPSDPN